MIRYIRGISVAVAAVAVAILFTPAGASAGPGECPAFTAATIDNCFAIWQLASEFDPVVDQTTCADDQSVPNTHIFLAVGGVSGPRYSAFTEEGEPGIFGAQMSARLDRHEPICTTLLGTGLSVPERHICRAEIIRSFTWRTLCPRPVPKDFPDDDD